MRNVFRVILTASLLVMVSACAAVCGVPVHIAPEEIGLPTTGASIQSVVLVNAGDEGNPNGTFYRVNGVIHPVDPNAPAIKFQVNLPQNWNGKLAHFGGGGFDGTLITGEASPVGLGQDETRPLARGYVTFGSDGGHCSRGWTSKWSMNDEALHNFASDQLKKVHDVAVKIASEFYGKKPERVYFIGGSNGGREALKAIQLFPDDYDGAVCLYPVLNWIPKAIHDSFNADHMHGDGWLSSRDYEIVRRVVVETCDAEDGLVDGIVSNPFTAEKARTEIFTKLAEYLTPAQIESLKNFYEPMTFTFPLANGLTVMPGYMLTQLLHDEKLSQFSTARENRDGAMEKYGDQVIQYEIVRGANFDPRNFKPEDWQKEIVAASEMLDATNPDLSRFMSHGGKLLLLHGGADQLVALQGSIDYYNALREKFGTGAVDEFMRFYFVPGYGHGRGDLFTMNRDLLSDLDAWVSEGKAPEVLIMTDQNGNRSRPLYRFPNYARYKGEGDVNDAESFEPASLMD